MSEFHLDYRFMLFFDLLYKYFTTILKVYKILRLVKACNWKPMTNTYHRGLDFFFRFHWTECILPRSLGRTDFPLCCSCESQGAENNASQLWTPPGQYSGSQPQTELPWLSHLGSPAWCDCTSSQRPQCPGSLALHQILQSGEGPVFCPPHVIPVHLRKDSPLAIADLQCCIKCFQVFHQAAIFNCMLAKYAQLSPGSQGLRITCFWTQLSWFPNLSK